MTRPTSSIDELRRSDVVLYAMPRVVRFQDVDAAGTIYYPRLLEYFGDAYLGLLGARGIDVPKAIEQGPWVAPIAHAEADYFAPLRFGDATVVEVVAARVGETSLTIGYRARSPDDVARVHAVGRTVHVFVDRTTFRKTAVPAEIRAAFP